MRRVAFGEYSINAMPVHVDNLKHPVMASDPIRNPRRAAEAHSAFDSRRRDGASGLCSVPALQWACDPKEVTKRPGALATLHFGCNFGGDLCVSDLGHAIAPAAGA